MIEHYPVWPTLRTVVERMIPQDDFPSGWEAGVGDFLMRIFATDLADRWSAVERTLGLLDDAARRAHDGRAFVDLTPEQQDGVLTRVERGDVHRETGPASPQRIVRLLADLCAEGYYGDPGNGGNRDMVGWRLIGYLPGAGGDRWTR